VNQAISLADRATGAAVGRARTRFWAPPGAFLVALGALVVWSLASANPFVAPPWVAAQQLVVGFQSGWILPNAVSTLSAVMIGFMAAILAGVTIGVILGASVFFRTTFEPLIYAGYSVPKIILFPIIMMFVGIGVWAQSINAFIHAVFPVIILTSTGIREVSPTLVKVGRVYNVGLWDFLAKIYFPSIALPLVVALRMGFSLSIASVIMAELFASKEGLGRLLKDAYTMMNFPRMYAVILFLFILGFTGNLLLWRIERSLRGHTR